MAIRVRGNRVSDLPLIVCGDACKDPWIAFATGKLLSILHRALGTTAATWMPRLIMPVAAPEVVNSIQQRFNCESSFPINGQASELSVLTPISLLPAAMLGLDCMKLLGGAHAMTEHYRDADAAKNIPLRLASILRHSAATWSTFSRQPAFESLAAWCNRLTDPNCESTLDVGQDKRGIGHKIEIASDSHRWEPLCLSPADQDFVDFGVLSREVGKNLCDLIRESGDKTQRDELAAVCDNPTRLTLPQIDIFFLGQVVQAMLLGVASHKRLA